MTSLVTAVDPELRDFVRLKSPDRTSFALLTSVACLSGAVLAQLAGPALALIEEFNRSSHPRAAGAVAAGWWIAAALLLIGSGAAMAIAPKSEPLLRAEWGRRRVALSLGLAIWAVTIVTLPFAFGWRPGRSPDPYVMIITTAWQLLASLAPLTGLRHVIAILGRRSQRWREARQGRQSVDALVAAGGGVLVFATAVPIMASYRFELLHLLAVLLAVTSAAVLVIGLMYLIMNAWWIVRSTIRPALPISDFVGDAEVRR